MDSYAEYPMQSGYQHQHVPEERRDASQPQPHYMRQPTTTSMSESHGKSTFYSAPNIQSSMSCEIKPRLTKEQHDLLEKEYGKQHKPNTATKKGFAEQLGVSLDKVNNWFQNRRAKSKQDAKKAAGAMNLFNAQQQPHQVNYSSDSDVSPAFSAPDYFSMMQQCTADDHASNGLGIDMQQFQDSNYYQNANFNPASAAEQYNNFQMSQQMSHDMFDSPQELNRRTITQEQFDFALAQQGNPLDGNLDYTHSGYGGQSADLQQYFPELQGAGTKQENGFNFAYEVPPPMSSHDSTVPSTMSDQSAHTFPSSSSIRDLTSASGTSSEWADSRSSSVSAVTHEEPFVPVKPAATSSSQWQPGQSVPVDFNVLNQEFQQARQARRVHEPPQIHEQPLAWPADDAYARRDSQTSHMLAQGMSNVGINTPLPQQQATFKSPAPPLNIAARRQRPRPAALGLNAMRSQSYNGTVQPGSPSQGQSYNLTPGQPAIRRIRSSNVMNGIAQGRVQKSMPGSAQRSPLAFSFADAMNSPKAMRHVSSQASSNLAPPTPLSPNEFPRHDQGRQHSGYHASGHVSRQPSISETDVEHGLPYVPAASVPARNFSSPPHTPMYHQQNFVQQRVGSNVITENTPPQSAPASQQCFAVNTFNMPQPQMPPPPPQQMQTFMQPPQQQFMNVAVPEQHFQVPNMSMAQVQQMMMPTSSAPAEIPMQYSQIPVFNAQGQLVVVPNQFLQQVPPQATTPQPQQMHTPPQGGQYITFSSAPPPPPVQVAAQAPKQQPQPTELFVHEYSPPAELKRAATPRKMVDSGPKNYTFANSTSNDYEEKRRKADAKAASASNTNSPASSAGAYSGSS